MPVSTLGYVRAEIHVVLFVELESQARSTAWEEFLGSVHLLARWPMNPVSL